MHQQEAQDSIAWANLAMKHRYDKHHIPLLLNPGDFVMLKLHHGYRVPGIKNKKLSIQRVGRFKIKRRVSPLAYELELPSNMKIHPVISVTNLEPLPPGEDPYKRRVNDHPPPIEEEDGTEDNNLDKEWKSFYIEKLLDKRLRRYGRGKKIIEYLVKWTGYGPEFNEWYGEDLLDNAVESMLEYELRQNSDTERIEYLRKLLAEKEKAVAKETEQRPEGQEQRQEGQEPPKRRRGRPRKAKNS